MSDRTFSERLRQAIDETPGLTPAGLALKAGLNKTTIRKVLDGSSQNPRFDTAMKICAALGTTVEEFMGSPRDEEERRILRLLSQLSLAERRQLLGYGEAMRDAADRPPEPAPPGDAPAPDDPSPPPPVENPRRTSK